MAAARGPFHLETVADQRCGVEIPLGREGGDLLAALLPDRAEGQERRAHNETGFLHHFTAGSGLGGFLRAVFPFWNGPCARVLAAPVWPARMDEQHLHPGRGTAVEKQPRAPA